MSAAEPINNDIEKEPQHEEEAAQASQSGPNGTTPLIERESAVVADDVNPPKPPPPKKHLFKMTLRQIKIRDPVPDLPYVRFTLGGDYKVEDKRHLGGKIEVSGKKGKRFRTEVCKEIRSGEGTFKKTFVKYWSGPYESLAEQELRIELFDHKTCWCRRDQAAGEVKLNLLQMANGCIQQDVEIYDKKAKKVTCELSFLFYFQEVWDYHMHLHEWFGANLIAADDNGTSDPYLKVAIPRDWGKLMYNGGVVGRSCQSDKIMNTLFPQWDEVGQLVFHGTRSELENEELKLEVWDWDGTSGDDLIGLANVPMRGMIDYGYLETALGLVSKVKEVNPAGINVTQLVVQEAGMVQGFVTVDEVPPHMQYGDIVTLLPGHRYLAIQIDSCAHLRATDANGTTDAFVVIEWDGMTQQTKPVFKSLDPQFDTILYFPVRMVAETKKALKKKGDIKISVFDYDEEGNDFIGGSEIPLWKITGAEQNPKKEVMGYKEKEFIKTRVYSAPNLALKLTGEKVGSSINVSAWFQADFPSAMVLEAEEVKEPTELPIEYVDRETVWRETIPKKLKDEQTYAIKALDESGRVHFVPTYLAKLIPPHVLKDPLLIFRMITCFTYADDDASFGKDDVWTSPNFFMDIKKGDSEDHALLMGNLFLGLELDVYCCVGKTRYGKDHTWLVTREASGDVTVWETCNGKRYKLPKRWKGIPEPVVEDPNAPADGAVVGGDGKTDAADGGAGVGVAGTGDVELLELAKDDKKDKKGKQKDGFELLKEKERQMVFFDDDVVMSAEEIVQGNEGFSEVTNAATPAELAKAERLKTGESGTNLLIPTDDDEGDDGLEKVLLPYASISIIFNNKNVWANIQRLDPARILYDMEDTAQWSPFCSFKDGFCPDVVPWYEAKRLSGKMPISRVDSLKKNIWEEVMAGYTNWRHGNNMETKFIKEGLPEVLARGLEYMERKKVVGEDQWPDIDKALVAWKGDVTAAAPAGCHFTGTALNFAYTDWKKIRKYIMNKYEYHTEGDEAVKYCAAVSVTPYHNSVCSVWVYIAKMVPAH